MGEFNLHHTCKGGLAIAEETIEACWDDPASATQGLVFAAIIAALKAGITIGELAQNLTRMEEPARVITGMDEHADRMAN